MENIKFGIIGIGNIGSFHANNLLSGLVTGGELAAVCDIDREKLKRWDEKKCGVPSFSSYKDMIDSISLDAVIVSVPHYSHGKITIYALEHGLNVICEKPEAVSVSEAMLMNETAKKSGKIFSMMFNQRTDPIFAKAHELVHSGVLGEKKRLTWIITNWYRTQAYYDSGSWRATWSGEGGGVLLNQAPHNIDLWQWIFGMPDSITAICSVAKYHNIEVEDDVRIIASYKSGATAEFITSTGEFPGTNRLEMIGDRAKMVLEDGKLKLWTLKIPEREFCFESNSGFAEIPTEYEEFTFDNAPEGHIAIMENFIDAVNGKAELISPGYEGINELTISNAAYLSAWTNKTVSIPFDSAEFDRHLSALASDKGSGKLSAAKETPSPERWKVRW